MTISVFDNHQHIGLTSHIVGAAAIDKGKAVEQLDDAYMREDHATRVKVMARLGIDQATLMPGHSYPRARGLADTLAMNDYLAAYRKLDPLRFPSIVGTIEPRYGEAGLAEIDRMHFELGFQGVSWHHRQQGLPINHSMMKRLVGRMAEIGLIPFIHTYVGADLEEIWRLQELAEMLPQTPILCMDAMSHGGLFDEAISAGRRAPNLLFDATAMRIGQSGIERMVQALGAERLLFGSNLYSLASPSQVASLTAMRAARISDGDRALILGGNARRLLGLANSSTG